jgi:hypothetical protein
MSDTLEEIRNMKPLDKLVRKYMWGHHINGTWFFHGEPKIDDAFQELTALRAWCNLAIRMVNELRQDYIPGDLNDKDGVIAIQKLHSRIAELEKALEETLKVLHLYYDQRKEICDVDILAANLMEEYRKA